MAFTRRRIAVGLAVVALAVSGCTGQATTTNLPESSPPATIDPHAGHAHASHGPHHGELIELGNAEEYHAELLHDDSSVTIYVLNGAADQQVAIDSTEIKINATYHGKPMQFLLTAKPAASDAEGKSSRFVSTDTELVSHIDEEGASHRLALTIDGKSYGGEIVHDHDAHAGHNH